MSNNAGFSAPVNYWGTIDGLTAKSSSDGKNSNEAEAQNQFGDTLAHDEYGETLAPSVEYAVTDEVDLSDIVLGKVYTFGTSNAKKLMLTQCQVNTQAANPPTVTLSGVEVESSATDKRLYELEGTITPRSRAQDVAGAFANDEKITAVNTTYSVDPHVQTVKGTPVASDASHGKVEAQATMTDGTGSGTLSAGTGFTITASAAESDPDAGYRTLTATATKYMTGEEQGS